jgi:hypothetical protein
MWNVVSLSTFHVPKLALSLFMFGVFADHTDHPFTFNNFAFITNFFDRGPDFHGPISPGK